MIETTIAGSSYDLEYDHIFHAVACTNLVRSHFDAQFNNATLAVMQCLLSLEHEGSLLYVAQLPYFSILLCKLLSLWLRGHMYYRSDYVTKVISAMSCS
jgi:hypothetical protein